MNNKSDIIERVMQVKKKFSLTNKDIGKLIGVGETAVSAYFSGKVKLPLDLVISFLNKYPQVSTDWLLFGEGEMEVDRARIDSLNEIIEEKDRIICALERKINQLENKIDTIINNLK